ncbi:MAG: alpha/beta hydrolase [Symbiobacteriia bacterium]
MNALSWHQRLAIEILALTAPRLLASELVKPRARLVTAMLPPLADARVTPIAFPTVGGAACRGWLVVPAASTPDTCVILAHGWSSNAHRVADWVLPLVQRGHAVLLYHARGHGDSDPTAISTLRQFAEDLNAAIAFAATSVPGAVVLGHSLGAAAAILAAAGAGPRPFNSPQVLAAVAMAAPAHPVPATLDLLRFQRLPAEAILRRTGAHVETLMGCSFDAIAPLTYVHTINVPTLLIHGTADPIVPPSHFHRLAAAASPAVEVSMIQGADHDSVLASPETRNAVLNFLDRALPAPT